MNPSPEQLKQIRNRLLDLHKALIQFERIGYEKTMGAITSPHDFFRLLTNDPWFAWLRPLSQLIVLIDETLDEKELLLDEEILSLMDQTRGLLVVSEVGKGFSKHYFEALQQDPDVVLAHGEIVKLLGPRQVPD